MKIGITTRQLWAMMILALVMTCALLLGTYLQMQKCAAVQQIIEDKGGPTEVCGWALVACEEMKEAGVIK